jgi:phosphomannomutase
MSDVRNRITPETEKLLDRALREALSMGKNSIEPVHIALALSRDGRHSVHELEKAYAAILKGLGA